VTKAGTRPVFSGSGGRSLGAGIRTILQKLLLGAGQRKKSREAGEQSGPTEKDTRFPPGKKSIEKVFLGKGVGGGDIHKKKKRSELAYKRREKKTGHHDKVSWQKRKI